MTKFSMKSTLELVCKLLNKYTCHRKICRMKNCSSKMAWQINLTSFSQTQSIPFHCSRLQVEVYLTMKNLAMELPNHLQEQGNLS